MAWNQTNRFQSLADSSIEEFIDEHGSENAKKKTKHNCSVPRISWFERRDKSWTRNTNEEYEPNSKFWTSLELFPHIFRMSYFILTSSAFLITGLLLDNLDVEYFTRKPFQCNSQTVRRLHRALFSFERKL